MAPTWLSGRRWQKGPSWAPVSTVDSASTQYGLSSTPSAIVVSVTWQPALTTHSAPIAVRPARLTFGCSTVSIPIVTVSST